MLNGKNKEQIKINNSQLISINTELNNKRKKLENIKNFNLIEQKKIKFWDEEKKVTEKI